MTHVRGDLLEVRQTVASAGTTRGKHVRCAGCQAIVWRRREPTTDTPLPQRGIPRRSQPEPHALETTPSGAADPVPEAIPGLQCASCQAEAVLQLPPDANSPTPGFVCAMCRTEMRQPGTAGNYYAAVFLGVIIALLGLGLAGVAFKANRAQVVGGGLALGVLGLAIAAWGRMQARRPVPTGRKGRRPGSGSGLPFSRSVVYSSVGEFSD